MKKLLVLSLLAGIMLFSVSCGDDEPIVPEETDAEEVVVSSNITSNTKWTADNIYVLSGRIFVTSGAELTIEAGTIIKGKTGIGSNASGLYIARGARILAVGSATKPIIFTSELDDIQPGQLKGTTLDNDDTQKWGGLVILGKAPVSPGSGTEAQIEGVPSSETLGLYGGTDSNDDSGVLKYVSIRHGGTTIDAAAGKDINGLTLGGVGKGTEISYIEIYANFDDGIEFFGGSVDVSNILVSLQHDDAFDVDQAYSGVISNFMAIQSADADEAFEIDGPEGSENATGKFTFQNGTIKSIDGSGNAGDFKSKAQGTVTNVKYQGYTSAKIKIRASYSNGCADAKTDALSNLTDATPSLSFSKIEFNGGVEVYTASDNGADPAVACTVKTDDQTAAEGKLSTESATGASDTSVWDSWTISAETSIL